MSGGSKSTPNLLNLRDNNPESATGNDFSNGSNDFPSLNPSICSSEMVGVSKNVSENPKIDNWKRALVGGNSEVLYPQPTPSTKLIFEDPKETDGESFAFFASEELIPHMSFCESFVVGYFVGSRRPTFPFVKEHLTTQLKIKGEFSMALHGENAFMFKFSEDEDRAMVLGMGSIFITGKLFLLRPWSPFLEQQVDSIKSIPIWMNIRGLPFHLWNATGLSRISSLVGKPIMSDIPTAMKTRMTFARVCVEITADFTFPDELPYRIDNEKYKVKVEYPWKPVSCAVCKSFGHGSAKCSANNAPKRKTQWVPKKISSTQAAGAQDDAVPVDIGARVEVDVNQVVEDNVGVPIPSLSAQEFIVSDTEKGSLDMKHSSDGAWTVYTSKKKKHKKVGGVPTSHLSPFTSLFSASEVVQGTTGNIVAREGDVLEKRKVIDETCDNVVVPSEVLESSSGAFAGPVTRCNDLEVTKNTSVEAEPELSEDKEEFEDSLGESEYETDIESMGIGKMKNLQEIPSRRPLSDEQKVDRLFNACSRFGVRNEGKDDKVESICNEIIIRSKLDPNKEIAKLTWPGVSDNKKLGRGCRSSARKSKD